MEDRIQLKTPRFILEGGIFMTLKDLADVIPVSRGTIDRVIHNRGKVSEKSEKLVLSALKEYGYIPNQTGRALAAIKKSYKVGVLLFKGEDPFNLSIINGIRQSFEKYKDCGFKLIEELIEDEVLENQKEALLRLAEEGADTIIFCPMVSPLIKDTMRQLADKGIVIITVNSDIDDDSRLCFVGHNNYQSGRTATSLLSNMIGNRGNVLIAAGIQEFESHIHRLEGALSFLNKEVPDVKIVGIITDTQEKVRESIMQTVERQTVHAILILSIYIEEIVTAVEELGLTGKIILGAFDLNDRSIKYLSENRINFIIDQSPVLQGQIAMDIAGEYLINKQKPEKKSNFTKTTIIMKENLSDYI